MSVSVGHGLFSNTSIHTAKTTACRYTNLIDPAKPVIASATRSWTWADLRSASASIPGCWSSVGWVGLIWRGPLVTVDC